MNAHMHRTGVARRGLTLLELMLAMAITGMVGVGIASMLTMVATGARGNRDGRSAVLRTHAAGVRLRAYMDPALCVLQHDPARGLVVWLSDTTGDGVVNLTEMRVIWWDEASREVSVERVALPEAWSPILKQTYDAPLPAGSDFFAVMIDQRLAGFTEALRVVDGLERFEASFDAIDVQEARRVDLLLAEATEEFGAFEAMISFGLGDHRAPRR
jgi:hypothetical protein